MEPFIVNNVIDNIEFLYGRSKCIDSLISIARRRENAGIIGARRFGKSCLLKSMLSYLELHSEINALPVYFDVKNDTNIHNNTPEVFYTLAALLAKKMCETGILQEGDFSISRRCVLYVSTDLSDMIVQMSSWHSEYQRKAFFNLTNEVYKQGRYVLLLLDEIDSLLLDALETPSDFGRIRGAATNVSRKLAFWIAGTSTWKSITSTIGSPELNCGLKPIRLSSMDKDAFSAMWKHECSLIEDEKMYKVLSSLEDAIYAKTGGVPFYAKYIGSNFVNGTITEMPDYGLLRDFLSEIYENRFNTEDERAVLKVLAKGKKSYKDSLPDAVQSLYNKGLLDKNDDEIYQMALPYLADYVNAISSNSIIETTPDVEKEEREILVDEIKRLRDNVNQSYMSQSPFIPSSKDPMLLDTLKKPCIDEGTLTAFATSLCILYYEGSEKGKRLPGDFFTHDFCNIIRALRNKNDHSDLEYEARQMEDARLFALINNGIIPYSTDHFKNIQSKILLLFKEELSAMLEKAPIKKQKRVKEVQKSSSANRRTIENGQYYEGVVVEVKNQYGTFLNIKCVQHPFPLQMISLRDIIVEHDVVVFKAVCEPNKKDPSKPFWKADDVHLKQE